MAHPMSSEHALLAPAAMYGLAGQSPADVTSDRTQMLRSISMDIREEREDLKKAAEQSLNAILELDLQGNIRWVSASWQDLTGASASSSIGRPVSDILAENPTIFAECLEGMRQDDSKSHFVRFYVRGPDVSGTQGSLSGDDKTPVEPKAGFEMMPELQFEAATPIEERPEPDYERIELEAQGIIVYHRSTGEESHTMWMVKPAVSREITIDLPQVLVDSLGIGAEMLANYLTLLADVGVHDPENHPPPLPVLCRICERQIVPWWFEKHTELCSQEHRAEMEVQMAQDSLNEQRAALVKVLDALEAQARSMRVSSSPDSEVRSPLSKAEYKGMAIGPNSTPSSGPSSGRASPAARASRSRDSSTGEFGHHRARSFAVRRPLARIVELVLDLCDTAMEISTPSIKDTKGYAPGELRTQSPQSEGRIQQVLQWQSPSASSLENEQGLALLCDDTSQLAKSKVEAVFRHRQIVEYAERIRVEYDILVQECIEAALQKAVRLAAGDLSDSSPSDESDTAETPQQGPGPMPKTEARNESVEPFPAHGDEAFNVGSFRGNGSPSAMAMALRNASDPALSRRASSVASSGTSSPRGATTPKSSSIPAEPFMFQKRGSVALESDAGGDSDTSMRSSVASASHIRADSPASEMSLSRVASTRSRDRKRQSLILPSLVNSARHQSPGRGPPPPSSPLRIAKPRLPSGTELIPSPITSPVLTSEFNSPVIRAQHQHHHRRQSSAQLSQLSEAIALGRPSSPRLSGVITNPQPRAVPTSIKDFEIIKPISKGAFGSVYLSKKKSTGDYFAIKVLKKADMVAKNQVTNVKAERAIMMWQGESDFVAKLYWTFSSKDYLYLVMEFLNGGDCASLIKVLGALPEDWTKKYMGEVVLCVQHLHSRQIVHRDLKPDNFLIDAKGHLKLTDFGLSRMGLIGRQKRAISAKPGDAPPDLLKAGPFRRAPSVASSRSASFDYQGNNHSPGQTPSLNPAFGSGNEPSYFSLYRESSREPSRRTSGHRSDSGESEQLSSMFRKFSIADGRTPIEEETADEEGGADSPDPYALQPVPSNVSTSKADNHPQGSAMPPPMMALFDPEDSNRRFVGTPDYLAPETINGAGQDEMSDWWSLGCILFECLYGRPPFNADTPEEVFANILARNIHWPSEDEEVGVSAEAKDLMNKLMCLDPKERLGANKDEAFADGGDEIKAHPWFADIRWDTLREDEASFIPMSENPEDTEYFDSRGASMQDFAAEFEDQQSSPAPTPGADYPDRPHDALSRVRNQVNAALKRNLMPLHIPPHVRDARTRRLSEPVVADDFGSFQFKNLPVLEKANKDVIQKLRADAMQAQSKSTGSATPSSSAVASPSPGPSLESSPVMPAPLKRTLSITKGSARSQSPSMLSQSNSSPSRVSQPSSPLLLSFTTGAQQERRKVSSGSSSLSQQTSSSLQPGSLLEQGSRPPVTFKTISSPSPIKPGKGGLAQGTTHHERSVSAPRHAGPSSPRQRSQTVGCQDQESDLVPELLANHHKRRSGVFPLDVSPSSSDTEETRHQAFLRVQRRRQSSRRLSQISLTDGPTFRTLDVLVCEDHPVSRFTMERLLEKLRCRTISVTNGSEAMRYAMSEVKFDIIMMEYKLPQVNGADVARMIRDTKNANSHTPIVAVTGYLKELQAPHHFDALVEKPPTKEKLEEVMGRLCQWKTPPDGWKPGNPQAISPSNLRQESLPTDDSPTTTTSSGFNFSQVFSSSHRGSSREDSIGSSSFGETESHFDSIPVIISRQPTMDWDQSDLERNFGGLGISGGNGSERKSSMGSIPPLEQQVSAPAALGTEEPQVPRKQPSMEAIQAKRKSLEKGRHESAAESGDDEDEELGHTLVRQRSPKRHVKPTSKLGTEMMRTNSRGSVISADELLSPTSALACGLSDHAIMSESAADVVASGKLTPPEVFPPRPGDHIETIAIAATDPDATPRPIHTQEHDPDPTPRAPSSPLH